MCGRRVHHWNYFLHASLGTGKTEKVRLSHVAESVADYPEFKTGVESLLEKFKFEGPFHAMLQTHSRTSAESIAAFAAHEKRVLDGIS